MQASRTKKKKKTKTKKESRGEERREKTPKRVVMVRTERLPSRTKPPKVRRAVRARRPSLQHRANLQWDGLFCSNGPGDPSQCKETIKSLKWAISRDVPIFGICLGNQLLALAAGAKTYKMKYGNRGMNQPCVDLRTTRCYITSQNHGYAVDDQSLPEGWKALFVNANDRADSASSLNLNLLWSRRRRAREPSRPPRLH